MGKSAKAFRIPGAKAHKASQGAIQKKALPPKKPEGKDGGKKPKPQPPKKTS